MEYKDRLLTFAFGLTILTLNELKNYFYFAKQQSQCV